MNDFSQYTSRLPSPIFKRTGPNGAGMTTADKLQQESSPTNESRISSVPFQFSNGISASVAPARNNPRVITDTTNRLVQNVGGEPEDVIQQLRERLDEAMSQDASAKTALSKSDAVILDLRSNQRQLKRQLELLQQEHTEMNKELQVAVTANSGSASTNSQQQNIESLHAHIDYITQQLEISKSAHSREQVVDNKNAKVGELQVQLDRAHAQILTADMVRKELEDTLEAEQYTWELRVQDQERQIVQLQQDCDTLVRDLDQCRSQWKEAEEGWTQELEAFKEELLRARQQLQQGENDSDKNKEPQQDLLQKIHQLESERAELQSCLDEALLELEAVDAELQSEGGDNGEKGNKKNLKRSAAVGVRSDPGVQDKITESLTHLLRWIYQEGPVEKRLDHNHLSSLRNDPQELVFLVQEALEGWLDATTPTNDERHNNVNGQYQQATIAELTNQITNYEEELKNREESSAELRESLKEAVALLKPLQDAVAQTEEEKVCMQRQLRDLETDRQSSQDEISQQFHQINSLRDQVSTLEVQLEGQKRLDKTHESLPQSQQSTTSPNLSRSSESTSTTNRSFGVTDEDESLTNIKRAREELRRKRETEGNLQKLLKDAQARFKNLHEHNEDVSAHNQELQGQIPKLEVYGERQQQHAGEQYQQDGGALAATLAERDMELQSLRLELGRMQKTIEHPSGPNSSFQKISSMEEELTNVRGEIVQREQVNNVLNKSLKEALGLLKPLQMHLEDAEMEKTEISKELRNIRKRFHQLQLGDTDDQSKSTIGGADVSVELIKIKDELEETVRQLELENSQLHDALEDLTEDGNTYNEAKMRQRLVEFNSRYEVTQNKLEDAHVENHALVKALKLKEMEEINRKKEMMKMEENLHKTESELNNAKRIAQSALVKVEELTMSNIEQLSISRDASSTVDGNDNVNKNHDNYGAYLF
mmetsp:Transcript_43407/g.50036  ORF Transcript_43407/g.50036 Transcript_43407/m.50036 type:complete len:940 (+) Transcript_43407:148-2967(+)